MDSLTHLVLGAALGEAALGKKIGRQAMIWGALANTIPDFDVFSSSCVSPAQQMMIHRGITHSFLFAIIVALLLGWLFTKWHKYKNVSQKNWTWLFFIGMFTHNILDAFTCYGTGWFEPFSDYRVTFNSIFVADPFYTLPFLICLLIALVAKNGSPKRIKWNKTGLIISSIYLLFTLINKQHVHSTITTEVNIMHSTNTDIVTAPTPFNNFLWMTYITDSTGYWFGYYSVFDKQSLTLSFIDKNEHLITPFKNNKDVELLKQFTKGYYCLTKNNGDVYFNDLRFGQIAGWDNTRADYAFSYNLEEGKQTSNPLARNNSKINFGDAIASLIKRIKGN